MRIAAVCTAYHEADILPWTVEHLLAEGIDHVYVEVPFGDRETIAAMRGISDITITEMEETYHDQPAAIRRMAAEAGADWILPFDADEFVIANSPTQNIRQAIEALPDDVGQIRIGMFQQRDWNWREVPFKPMPKVAYRWNPEAHVSPGNHSVEGVQGESAYNVLTIREIQYRSFEHFCRKVEERNRTLDPNAGPSQGIHMTKLKDHSVWKLGVEWEKLNATPVIWDPIPSQIRPPEHLAPPVELLPMDKLFTVMVNTPCDIHGHMERLRELAAGKRVLELGVNTGMSTIAFMAGEPTLLDSVDIAEPRVRPELLETSWEYEVANDLDIVGTLDTGEYDVIFIDTDHTMRQTVEELKAYEPKVAPGGCLVLHDSESSPEVALAIAHFLYVLDERGRTPTKIEKYSHSEGLTILWLP
jgi:hypothetical protein